MYNAELEHCYITIPKNASSFLREYFKDNNWRHFHLGMQMNVRTNIIILRDPIDRWITGISQHITTNILGENFGSTHFLEQANELVEKIIFDQIVFDDHTEQQSWFLEPFDIHNSIFFKFDDLLAYNLDSYFSKFSVNYDLKNKPFVNVSKNNFDNANLVTYFKKLIYNNRDYYNNLRSYYVRDYDLINSVQFYAG